MIFQIILILIALALLGAIGFGAYLLLKSLMKKQSSQTALPQFKSKLTLKLFAVAIVGLLSLIPLGMIQDLSQDRESLYRQVVREIGHTWGDAQTLAGPVLVLPFRYEVISDNNIDGKQHRSRQVYSDELLILPKGMTLDAGLQHEFRHRGIYQSLVYLGQVKGRANFELPKVNIPGLLGFDYNQARLVFGVSANQAIETVSHFNLAGEQGIPSLMSGTGLDNTGGLSRGFHRTIALDPRQGEYQLTFQLSLRGSEGLEVLPLAELSQIDIHADWPHPSFQGYLPASRNLSTEGFDANWQISHLSRNFPQMFRASDGRDLTEISASVTLFEPVTHYGKIERSLKYGILFILLTYILLLIFELGNKSRLSAVQYLMVGGAMCLFYLLLLSLSEHLLFLTAYLVAAAVPLLSIPLYVASASGSRRQGAIVAAMLASLYGVLYSILQLEDYALLMGTGLLVLIMMILMYLTRHQQIEE